MPKRGGRGFTIVEVMVVVAIIGLLALVSVPYTLAWIHDADVRQSSSILQVAHGRAKMVAIRNPTAALDGSAAAGMKYESGMLLVCTGAPSEAECVPAGPAVIWQGDLPGGVVVTSDDAAFESLSFDNVGRGLDGAGIPIAVHLTVSKGAKNDTVTLR